MLLERVTLPVCFRGSCVVIFRLGLEEFRGNVPVSNVRSFANFSGLSSAAEERAPIEAVAKRHDTRRRLQEIPRRI